VQEILQELFPHLRAIWRYRWQALLAAWMIAVAGWLVVLVMPDKYEANARVYVDTDSILLPLLKGLAVQTDVDQRLLIMTRTLLSRPNLEKVVREVNLDLKLTTQKEKEALINGLSNEIKLVSQRNQPNLYTITYVHDQPIVAKQVVQALLSILVETTLGDSRQDSDSAQQFLARQIKEYDARLVAAEERLMEFKRENFRVLPSQEGGFFQDLKQAEQSLEAAKLEMREAEFLHSTLEQRLLEFVASFEQGEVVGVSRFDERLKKMQAQLDENRLRFTDVHPNIIELERAISELEALKKGELKGGTVPHSDQARPEDSRLHQELSLALTQANARIASLSARMNEYQQRADVLKERIATLPEIEADLLRLTRDYDITKGKYRQLVERFESAKLSESAGQTGDNVKFRIIDPPWVPATASEPNRILLLTFVLAAAIGVGVGFAVLIGFVRPVVYDMYGLAKITDLSIYGAVSRIDNETATLAAFGRVHTPFFIFLLLLFASYGGGVWLSMQEFRLIEMTERVRGLM